ncbi:MAG: diphthine--ammonia ligase [Nitrososphaerota archaeon]|nr:diphthine--ammonia ligase [Nitrososphaerota archaeon]MDG7024794.1 diphthine--ammonia ligase [Nitrososphaerota archaeon]
MPSPRALLSWSGGKDSALALYEVQKSKDFEVVSLLTTLTKDFNRISMHGVRKALLDIQASRIGVPVEEVWISKGAANVEYESQLSKALSHHYRKRVRTVIFGDLFLEDIRKYREDRLSAMKMKAVFPNWKRDTRELASYFIKEGFSAILCTVDPRALDPAFCGREFDESLLSDLPATVDPCGENGEFHTLVYGGPIFEKDIEVRKGEVVLRDGFYFADIFPG